LAEEAEIKERRFCYREKKWRRDIKASIHSSGVI
jgi:hypothetical protein